MYCHDIAICGAISRHNFFVLFIISGQQTKYDFFVNYDVVNFYNILKNTNEHSLHLFLHTHQNYMRNRRR